MRLECTLSKRKSQLSVDFLIGHCGWLIAARAARDAVVESTWPKTGAGRRAWAQISASEANLASLALNGSFGQRTYLVDDSKVFTAGGDLGEGMRSTENSARELVNRPLLFVDRKAPFFDVVHRSHHRGPVIAHVNDIFRRQDQHW